MINALLGDRYLEEGILPTTNEISVLKFAEDGVGSMEQNADGFFVRRPPTSIVSLHPFTMSIYCLLAFAATSNRSTIFHRDVPTHSRFPVSRGTRDFSALMTTSRWARIAESVLAIAA